MKRAWQPVASFARNREGGPGLGSWSSRIHSESAGAGGSTHGSHARAETGASRPWLESRRSAILPVIDMFTEAWERGEAPSAEDYLHHLDPSDSLGAVELIYREFCLAEADGLAPDSSAYLVRFPAHREALERLLHLHDACPASMLGRWFRPTSCEADLPNAGDSIGPYLLRRELGRGSFARVFLAEEADLENRLIVVKVSTRVTREPWLLARARHAHIVEIMRHTLVDDGAFQLICMPFFGGATLGAVLDVRRQRSRAAASGLDLLDDLDRAAAPEFSGAHNLRPARELLARLSYQKAIAWIVARLAEALDHAFICKVAHGDVKPSNILLSADANPMLLDFNLARDGDLEDDDPGRDADPGGTLAYMAPERLRALASRGPAGGETIGGCDPYPLPIDRAPHLADLYALGMVLLEALTGRPPASISIPGEPDAASRGLLLRSAARVYAEARDRSARSIVRDSEIAGGRPIAPGLRAILERCLDPDPARRYGRSLELAEDLDRWRTERALAFTDEPFWGLTLPRWARRQRPVLIAAVVCLLMITLTGAALLLRGTNLALYRDLKATALDKLARIWDDPDAGALGYQRPQTIHFLEPDDRRAIELARRVLKDYDILGSSDVPGSGDWRQREDVRRLPAADREELEVWLMERAYRYCRSLENRPHSPSDWERAMKILDRVGGPVRIQAFEPMRARLLAKLGAGLPENPSRPCPVPAPPWLDEHLHGFVIECEPKADDRSGSPGLAGGTKTTPAGSVERRRAAERALRHYTDSLALRPDSYWGRYRAAGICYGLGRVAEAAGHLEHCVDRRPENAALRGQLAGCLIQLKRYPEALALCDEVLERAPEHAEFYRTRGYVRTMLGQTAGLRDEIRDFEMRRDILPPSLWDGTAGGNRPGAPDLGGLSPLAVLDLEPRSARRGTRDRDDDLDAEELTVRAWYADAIHNAGELEIARIETDKILMLNPDHISARLMRIEQSIEARQFDVARLELDAVLNHPRLTEYLVGSKNSLRPFYNITLLYLKAGRGEEARTIARRTRDLAYQIKRDIGKSQFYLARVYAMNGRSDPRFIEDAAKHLHIAFVANPDFKQWYRDERWFDPVRIRIDAALERMTDPAEVRRRLALAR